MKTWQPSYGVNTPYIPDPMMVYIFGMKHKVMSQQKKMASLRQARIAGSIPQRATEPLERPVSWDEGGIVQDESGCALKIAGVYQDSVTRDWATEMCRAGTPPGGEEYVQMIWHNVNSLSDPAILLEAVRAALVADVIVVSVYAADQLPLDLYVWIDVWLPRRLSRPGALAALIGVAESPDSQNVRTREYLQAVARRGQLDFIPQERERAVPRAAGSGNHPSLPSTFRSGALPNPTNSISVPVGGSIDCGAATGNFAMCGARPKTQD